MDLISFIKGVLEYRMGLYAVILLTAFIGAVGDAFFNQAAKYSQPRWIIAGLLCLNAMGLLFYCLVLKELMGWSIIVLLLANMVFALAIGCWYFKERLSPWDMVGVALAVLAMIAMELGHASRIAAESVDKL